MLLPALAALLLPAAADPHQYRTGLGKSFQSGGPNFWHFRWGGSTWPRGGGGGFTASQPAPPDPAWSAVVPSKLSSAPPQLARLSWPGTKDFPPNSTVLTGWVEERPELRYAAGPGLYTVIIAGQLQCNLIER